MFDLHAISSFATGTGEAGVCKLWNNIFKDYNDENIKKNVSMFIQNIF